MFCRERFLRLFPSECGTAGAGTSRLQKGFCVVFSQREISPPLPIRNEKSEVKLPEQGHVSLAARAESSSSSWALKVEAAKKENGEERALNVEATKNEKG